MISVFSNLHTAKEKKRKNKKEAKEKIGKARKEGKGREGKRKTIPIGDPEI